MVEKVKGKVLQKILVTGASGMLGSDLCGELSEDYEVIGLDFSHCPPRPAPCASFLECDITNRDKIVESIVSVKPDLVIHAAAWTNVDGCEREPDKTRKVNGEGTRNVAQAASRLDIRLLYISTDFVFDGTGGSAYTEKDDTNPLNIYGESKLQGELAVRALDKYIIIRSGWLYGSNGKNFVDTILNEAKKESELAVVDDQRGSPTYTRDLAKAIDKLIEISPRSAKEIYHITNKGEVSWFDYAREILNIAGVKGVKVMPITSIRLARPAKRPAFSILNNAKFERAAGFSMRPWQEALRDYIGSRPGGN